MNNEEVHLHTARQHHIACIVIECLSSVHASASNSRISTICCTSYKGAPSTNMECTFYMSCTLGSVNLFLDTTSIYIKSRQVRRLKKHYKSATVWGIQNILNSESDVALKRSVQHQVGRNTCSILSLELKVEEKTCVHLVLYGSIIIILTFLIGEI